jgi:hypothetical protein
MRAHAIDLALSLNDAVSDQSVIAMFPKVYDVAPDKACLIVIPAMNENGRKLASSYRIELIEVKNQEEVIKALEACLSEKTIPQLPT